MIMNVFTSELFHGIHFTELPFSLFHSTEKPCDEELDMLDLAYELSDTSRLGCQIVLTKELNGLEVQVPSTINDVRS